MAEEYSSDRSPLGGGSLGWVKHTGEPFLANLEKIFFYRPKGTVEVAETPAGFHVVKVDDRVAPSKAVRLATIVNAISPSNETVNKLYNDAQNLASGKNSSGWFAGGYSEFDAIRPV